MAIDTDKLEALHKAATDGPWYILSCDRRKAAAAMYGTTFTANLSNYPIRDTRQRYTEAAHNANLLLYLRNAVPDILALATDLNRANEIIAEKEAEITRLRGVVAVADDAIREMFRYYDGGEMRGSYDGKPERAQLRKAGYTTSAALKEPSQ